MKRIEYWEVGDAYDPEGRGPFKAIANFSTEKVANEYANGDDKSSFNVAGRTQKNGRGNYGNPADVRHHVLLIADSIEEMDLVATENIRQAALAKLSPEERKVLGV